MISVEIRSPDLSMIAPWDALSDRAGANVFMHPAALCAADASGFAKVHALLAWDSGALVGFWALREPRVTMFCRTLAAPPYEYAFVSNPLIDPAHHHAVMPAFFDAIENDSALPNVIQLKLLDGGSDTFRAAMAALKARGAQMLTLSEQQRPFLANSTERKRSGSTAKKLRQDWNRLSAIGAVDIANERAAADVRAAFEIFLTLESQGWKGRGGTALLSHDEDAAFTRRLIGDLAAHGRASVALLRVDARAIAAQVLLYGGATAYTWKTAFDAEFAKFSPGALLIDRLTDALFADGIAEIESCSPAGSFMENLWTGRRMTVDMLADIGAQRSVSFSLAALAERGYALARAGRDAVRGLAPPLPKRKGLAVTRS